MNDTLTLAQKKAVRAAMEERLALYRSYKYSSFERREARVTASYDPRYHGATNAISDPTAQIAVYNVNEQMHRSYVCDSVEIALSLLPDKQRSIIETRYMRQNTPTDMQVCDRLSMSKDTYDRQRLAAMYEMALFLEVDCGFELT
ncbi:ArpU family phage packaging/lysis transcriptional regulator [Paenibacillus oleatilyticus]|uniref:ArpU family phage packaging/lysis transcriptional regulator n=1 Tax=Paenibacillus oleatilyticus TaxID=2594886 RepID=A0ABV4VB73_9BACL